MSGIYFKILEVKSGRWILGKIESHQARPLNESELDELIENVISKYSEVDSLRQRIARLEKALITVKLHFERNNLSSNFHGDEEHETWNVIIEALSEGQGGE